MIPDALRDYTQEQYNLAVFYIGLALTGFLVGYHYTRGCWFFPTLAEKITFFDDDHWLWRLVLIGALIGFAPIVYFTGSQFGEMFEGMMGMRATWGGLLGRGRYGDARAAFLMLEMFVGEVAPSRPSYFSKRAARLYNACYAASCYFGLCCELTEPERAPR